MAATLLEIVPRGHAFCESSAQEGCFKDWSELSPEAQEKLEGIEKEIEALVLEGRKLIQ